MLLYIVVIVCAPAPCLRAGIVINEVLANEPGGSVTLEWIELYNNAVELIPLDGYRLQVGSKSILLSSEATIAPGGFFVVCRRLYTDGGSPGFEEEWGDNSGIWGDIEYERTVPEPVVASFSLTNLGGSVEMHDGDGLLISEFTWVEEGLDGYSWERTEPASDEIGQSTDSRGATPGQLNSLTPVTSDLTVEVVDVQPGQNGTILALAIINVGTSTVEDAILHLVDIGLDIDSLAPDTLEVITIETMSPGDTVTVERTLSLTGVYTEVEAILSNDDRPVNNRIEVILPGAEFPPLILSEVLVNPTDGFKCEWVEIFNRSEKNIDLIECQFGDSVTLRRIVTDSRDILPGEYVVLAQNMTEFLDYYPLFEGNVVEPQSWASFNNITPDAVRLMDQFGFELDRFSYCKTFDSNYTWSRDEQTIGEPEWDSSENPGGTPGEPNEIYFGPTGNSVAIMIEPRVFSPDGDGIDESVTIRTEAPPDHEYKMKVYDRQGRIVFDFNRVRNENFWDGRNNSGERLPIGIYIVYLEVVGGESTRKTVVIAR